MRYWIFIGLFFGCFHNIFGQDPLPPTIDYVTVLASGQVYIKWSKNSPPDINGYLIREYTGPEGNGKGYTIKVINDPDSNSAIFDYPKVKNQSVKFAMNSFIGVYDPKNEDGVKTSWYSTPKHRTVFLSHTKDTCANTITLSWTKYLGWEVEIYQLKNEMGIPIGKPSTDTTQIEHYEVNKWNKYYVSAKRKNDITWSNSNIDSVFVSGPKPPAFINADQASFNSDNFVEVQFTLDPSSEIRNYQVTKSIDSVSGFQWVKKFPNYTPNSLTITDDSINQTTYYRLELLNSCDRGVKFSNLATAIVPVITARNNEIQLQWSAYNYWPSGVQSYEIFRNDEPIPIGSNPSQTSYSENINDLKGKQLSGNICYHVEAISKDGSHRSKSAKVCIDLDLSVIIPEGFTPNGDGKNDVFLPTFAFQPTNYSLVVFNRYGFIVFESKNSDEGWNGILNNGKSAPDGVYVYFITYKSSSGKTFEKRGNISLIYP